MNFHDDRKGQRAIRQNCLLFAEDDFFALPLTEIFLAVYGLPRTADRGDLRQIAPRKKSAKRPAGFKASRQF